MGKFSTIVISGLLLFSVCGLGYKTFIDRPSQETVQRVKNTHTLIDEAKKQLAKDLLEYEKFTKSEEFKLYEDAARLDDWQGKFKISEENLNKSLANYNKHTLPQVSNFFTAKATKKDEEFLKTYARVMKLNISSNLEFANSWKRRKDDYLASKNNIELWNNQFASNATYLEKRVLEGQNLVSEFENKYPEQKSSFYESFSTLKMEIESLIHELQKFSALRDSKNYLLASELKPILEKSLVEVNNKYTEFIKNINTLAWVNSKFIYDLKVEPKVFITRTLLNKDEDSRDSKFEILMDLQDYSIVSKYATGAKNEEDVKIGFLNPKREFVSVDHPERKKIFEIVKKYNINLEHNLQSTDLTGYLYLDNFNLTTYQVKFAIAEPGKLTKTEWLPASFEDFAFYAKHFGMEGARKMVGQTEMEDCDPSPLGFTLITSNRGKWVQVDGDPNQYWEFGNGFEYLGNFYQGTNRIKKSDYDEWLKGKKFASYYGSNKNYGLYGTAYQETDFAKQSEFVKLKGFSPEFIEFVHELWKDVEDKEAKEAQKK